MRKVIVFCLAMTIVSSLLAGTKESGTTIPKDPQPAGTTDKKHKNQRMTFFSLRPLGTNIPAGPAKRLPQKQPTSLSVVALHLRSTTTKPK
jgi:hypothetical protein